MIRKSWWLALGVAAFLGCDSVSNPEPNNNIPPSPPDMKHEAAKTGPAAPKPQSPTDYPGLSTDRAKEGNPEAAPKAEEPKPEAPKADESKGEAPKDEAKAETVNLSDEEVAQIKKLPEAEQALALKQKVCPISGEHLGEMGKPYKVSAGGETFYLCCSGCEKDLKDEAKLKDALAKLKTTK